MNLGAPSDEDIRRAEGRLTDARRELAASRVRARATVRAALVKPRTLLGVALAAGAAGYFLFRRPAQAEVAKNWLSHWPALSARWEAMRAHLPSVGGPSTAATATTAAGATSLVGIVLAFAARYAMQQLPRIGFQIVEQALRKQRTAAMPSYRPGTALH
jgi:hypothetical protein